MIVGYYFDGDNGDHVQWQQHDVYRDACRIIILGCYDHVKTATVLLSCPWPSEWLPNVECYDHRTIPVSHDLLAAVWRYKTNCGEPDLFWRHNALFTRGWPYQAMDGWLYWLRDEIKSWSEEPELIRAVMTIIANQNNEVGYEAEERLARLLRQRFSSVPWRTALGKS